MCVEVAPEDSAKLVCVLLKSKFLGLEICSDDSPIGFEGFFDREVGLPSADLYPVLQESGTAIVMNSPSISIQPANWKANLERLLQQLPDNR